MLQIGVTSAFCILIPCLVMPESAHAYGDVDLVFGSIGQAIGSAFKWTQLFVYWLVAMKVFVKDPATIKREEEQLDEDLVALQQDTISDQNETLEMKSEVLNSLLFYTMQSIFAKEK